MSENTHSLAPLPPLRGRSVLAGFEGGLLSSNGGALLLRAALDRMGIAERLAACLPDRRDPKRVRHSYAAMLRARIVAIACGHEDCDDLDALRGDPALKMACGRLPETGRGLPSQPTLSRLENLPDRRALARMARAMLDFYCASCPAPPRRLVLDIDDTVDLTHGAQQLSLFSGHAGGYCVQPIHIYDADSGKPLLCLLRPGKRPSGVEAARVLRRVVRRLRRHWPDADIAIRGDGHYGTPEVMDALEALGCCYIFGLPGNARLAAIASPWGEDAALRRLDEGTDACRAFFETEYAAKTWTRKRRVIARVDAATDRGVDTRFIVTNMADNPGTLYQRVYCMRGRMENMIKDHKLYTKSDRTSCHRWEANQFRLFLHTAAYWLLLTLRNAAPNYSPLRKATFDTIRNTFLKIAVRVVEMRTRIKLAFPAACPNRAILQTLFTHFAPQPP